MGLKKNAPLPNWLKCEVRNSVLILHGTPGTNDTGELIIKVLSLNKYLLK